MSNRGPHALRGTPATPLIAVLTQTSVLLFLAGVWIYYAGWIMAYTYFNAFGIGISQLLISPYTMMTFGTFVVKWNWADLLALLVALGVQSYFLWRMHLSGLRSFVLIILFLCVLLVSADIFGERTGRIRFIGDVVKIFSKDYSPNVATQDRRYAEVYLASGSTPNGLTSDRASALAEDLATGCYVIVWADTNALYVLKSYPAISDKWSINLKELPIETMRLSLKNLSSFRIVQKPRAPCQRFSPT